MYNAKDNLSDLELVVDLEIEAKYKLDEKTNLFSKVFATKADQSWKKQKKDYKMN